MFTAHINYRMKNIFENFITWFLDIMWHIIIISICIYIYGEGIKAQDGKHMAHNLNLYDLK